MHQPEDILHKELESKVAMLKHKKLEVMQPKIKSKSELLARDKPYRISLVTVQSWLINTAHHFLIRLWEKGGGERGDLKERAY